MFICPKCKNELSGFYLLKCTCGYEVPKIDSIYQFTDEAPISLANDGHKYLGYEYVGENYEEPNVSENIVKNSDYGIYGACSKKLVELLGKNCVVLDLGCGLGPASIPLAMEGAKTIAADISQNMLSVGVERAKNKKLDENLIFVRMNGYKLMIAEGSVDAVVAIDMLHQVDEPETVVKEILRVLKPNGVFVQYGCRGLPLTETQREINAICSTALNDIQDYYQKTLTELGYVGLPFSSWVKVSDFIDKYFYKPKIHETNSDTSWTGKMQKGIHKLKTRASGSAQLIPDDMHCIAWTKTDKYAKEKYGDNYYNMPSYSRFTGVLEIYKLKV